MERTCILRDDIQGPPQSTEASPIDAVGVCCTHHIRSGFMDCRMNHERSSIEQSDWSTSDDLTFVVDLN